MAQIRIDLQQIVQLADLQLNRQQQVQHRKVMTAEMRNRYLSAILLDSEYYSLLIEQTTMVDGLHIATPEALILLKMHAHLNLIESPHHYDNKQLKDVIKLSALLEEDSRVTLLGRPKEDFTRFMPLLEQEDPKKIKQILASMNVHNLNKDAVLGILTSVYQ